MPREELENYQVRRLRTIVRHASENVPYYRSLFEKLHFNANEINTLDSLSRLPTLTKAVIRQNLKILLASNAKKFHPFAHRTSGSTGEPIEFYLDKPSNVLEFCYYWRHWRWAGYRLGNTFVEFANDYFLMNKSKERDTYHFNPKTRSLKINTMILCDGRIRDIADCIRKFKPNFLFGLPSSMCYLAFFLKKHEISDITFKALFSHGEMLLAYQRKYLENVFECKVFDSYGHMERTVGISECEKGGYHINSEYGILEIIEKELSPCGTTYTGKIVGTSLHNFAMPFIRYEVNDYIEAPVLPSLCSCGRRLPLITKIYGRKEDAIITPDNRIITCLFTLYDEIEGVALGQIVQTSRNELLLRIAKTESFTSASRDHILSLLKGFVGDGMRVKIDYVTLDTLRSEYPRKFKVVVSHITDMEKTLRE